MANFVPDFSVGFSEAELAEIFRVQKLELLKTMQQWNEGGSMLIKRRLEEINHLIALCQRALQRLNPAVWGASQAVGQSEISPYFTK